MGKKKKGACVIFEKPDDGSRYSAELNELDEGGSAEDYLARFFPEANTTIESQKPENHKDYGSIASNGYEQPHRSIGEAMADFIMSTASNEDYIEEAAEKAIESYLKATNNKVEEDTHSNDQHRTIIKDIDDVLVDATVNKVILSKNKKFISLIDPMGHVVKIPVIKFEGCRIKDDMLFEELAKYITVALAPRAVYKSDELYNLLDENYIQAFPMNVDLMTSEYLGDYIFMYKYEESLVQNLINIANELGEDTFAATVNAIVDGCAQFNVMGVQEFTYIKARALYSTESNDIAKNIMIEEIKNSFDGNHDMHEINSYDMIDFITDIQYEIVLSLLETDSDNTENIKEEKENDSGECDEYNSTDGQGTIPDVVESSSGESGANRGSGDSYTELLQNTNPYAGEIEEHRATDVQQFDGFREINNGFLQEETQKEEKEEETRSFDGDLRDATERYQECKEETQKEEKEEEVSMVIPVRRG